MVDELAGVVVRENTRVCAPSDVTRHLGDIALASDLVVVVDLDALGEIERPLWLVLDALSYARVQIVVASRRLEPVASGRWWAMGPSGEAVAMVRQRVPSARVIVISDDPEWLGAGDGTLSIDRPIAMRAALWWIVKRRAS